MHVGEVSLRRMRSVRLGGSSGLGRPEDVVRWLGALQAQDVSPARWSIGQRLASGTTEDVVKQACDEGRILRTHVLRPTWHFVCPEDLRWLQALTGPRVQAGMATALRTSGLTADVLLRCHDLIGLALTGGTSLTRPELAEVLARGGVEVSGNPLAYVMLHAELEALVCSGRQRGKQQTYALVEERVAAVPPLERDDALVALALRYFTSRGPATAKRTCAGGRASRSPTSHSGWRGRGTGCARTSWTGSATGPHPTPSRGSRGARRTASCRPSTSTWSATPRAGTPSTSPAAPAPCPGTPCCATGSSCSTARSQGTGDGP